MSTPGSYPSGMNSSTREEPALWSRAASVLGVIIAHRWAFAAAGTLAMVVFFWRIRFLPSITLTDIGLVAIAIVVFSILLMLVFLATLLIPAALLVEWHQRGMIFSASGPRRPGSRERHLALNSILSLLVGAAVALLLLYASLATAFGKSHDHAFLILVGLGAIAALGPVLRKTTPSATAERIANTRPWRGLWPLSLAFASTALYLLYMPIFVLVVIGTHEAATALTDWQFGLMLLLLPPLHYLFFLVLSSPARHKSIAALAIIFYVVMFAGTLTEALDRAANIFQLGLLKHHSVVVSSEGCRITKSSRVVRACHKLEGSGEALYEIRDVQILTRLGSHAVIARNQWTPAQRTGSVPIPSAHVRSWFPTAPVKGLPRAPHSRAPAAMVDIPTQRPVPTPRASRKAPARRKTVSCVAR